MTQSTADKLAEVHKRALKHFGAIYQAQREERLNCLADRRFYSIAGAQWEDSLGDQFANLPRFEINKIQLAVIRIFNEYRNNRVTALFRPKDDSSSADTAETLNGLFRADEADSTAQEAYDNAFEEAVGGGFGAWRIRATLEDEEEDESDDNPLRIVMEPIYDADTSVFFDLDAKRYDKKDATRCYVLYSLTPDAYEDQYPDNPIPASWPKPTPEMNFDWFRPNLVFIAEYYEIEKQSQTVHVFRGLDNSEKKVDDEDLDAEKAFMLKSTGFREVRQETKKVKRCHKYILNGSEVIQDAGYIAGPNIPIVPVFGKRWYVQNIERCCGHVRTSKDAQRLKNMQISRLGQIASLSPIEKPIFTPEQIAGHEKYWANDNIDQYPYLLANPATGLDGNPVQIGPAQYTKAPNVPPALGALLQLTETDLQDILGNQAAGEQLQPNQSGKAVELIQNRLDMQTFIYMDNFKKSVQRGAEIWYGMAKETYIEEGRKMKTVSPQGETDFVELMRPMYDQKTGEMGAENDLSDGKFECLADVGPSFVSRKDATVRSLTGMMQMIQDPETLQILTAAAIMNMDFEGSKDLNDYFRAKLVRMGAVKPSDQELQEMQQEQANQQPDANTLYLQSASRESDAKAQKAMADTALTKAKTLETLSGIDLSHKQHANATAETLHKITQPTPAPSGFGQPVKQAQ